MTEEWNPPTPEYLLGMFAENTRFMENYIQQTKYEMVDLNRSFELGDYVVFNSFMWGPLPVVVTSIREYHLSCHLIGCPDRCTGWERKDGFQHIRLLNQPDSPC